LLVVPRPRPAADDALILAAEGAGVDRDGAGVGVVAGIDPSPAQDLWCLRRREGTDPRRGGDRPRVDMGAPVVITGVGHFEADTEARPGSCGSTS
jgi:hypothetical protein